MAEERERIIHPIVGESVQHNAKVRVAPIRTMAILLTMFQVISQIRSLTASLFGVAAGVLGLESLQGFFFYFLGTIFISQLISSLLANGEPDRYFESRWNGLWGKDVFGGLSSFVLTWTLFYGLVRS